MDFFEACLVGIKDSFRSNFHFRKLIEIRFALLFRTAFIISLSTLFGFRAHGQTDQDLVTVTELRDNWMTYEGHRYVPYVSTESLEKSTVSFFIPVVSKKAQFLQVEFQGAGTIFINNQFFYSNANGIDSLWSINSLSQLFSSTELFATVYFKDASSNQLVTRIVEKKNAQDQEGSFWAINLEKVVPSDHQPFILYILLFCGYMAVLRKYLWKEFQFVYNVTKVFSDQSDDFGGKNKFFIISNIFILAFIPGLIVLILVYLKQYRSVFVLDADIWRILSDYSLVRVFSFSFLLLFVKYFLLSSLSRLFSLESICFSQYYAGIKLGLFGIFLMIITMAIYGGVIGKPIGLSQVYLISFIYLVVKGFILGFKLIASSSFKKLHLFSYLCGTEIIPQTLLIGLVLG